MVLSRTNTIHLLLLVAPAFLSSCGLLSPESDGPGSIEWSLEFRHWAGSPSISTPGTIYVPAISLFSVSRDGQTQWEIHLGRMADGSSIASDGTIYACFADNVISAIQPDGTILWTRSDLFHGMTPAQSGQGSVYLAASNALVAVDSFGSTQWEIHFDAYVIHSPAIDQRGTIFMPTSAGLYAIDPDGEIQWQFTSQGSPCSSPAIGFDNAIYAAFDDGLLYCLEPDGSVRWYFSLGYLGSNGSPVIGYGEVIYICSRLNRLYAITWWGDLYWFYDLDPYPKGTPLVAADSTLFVSGEGKIDALSWTGDLKWRRNLGAPFWASDPNISDDGILYVSCDKTLFAIRTETGGLANTSWPRCNADQSGSCRVRTMTYEGGTRSIFDGVRFQKIAVDNTGLH